MTGDYDFEEWEIELDEDIEDTKYRREMSMDGIHWVPFVDVPLWNYKHIRIVPKDEYFKREYKTDKCVHDWLVTPKFSGKGFYYDCKVCKEQKDD